jgi:poly(3-hydroxybutyrate) depolymerase
MNARHPVIVSATIIAAACMLPVRSVNAAGRYVQITYPPSSEDGKLQIGVTHTVWIPDGVKTLRGVIVHQHGCGVGACKGGETAAYDLHWQELARKWDCALLGPSYHQAADQNCRLWCDPRNGSDVVFVKALEDLAKKSSHPELARVPWCLWGHSGGGFWASLMQMEYPERIVAIWFQSGTAHSRWVSGEIEKPKIPAAAMKIPMIANPGFKERGNQRFKVAYDGCYAMVKDYRSKGAPIAFTPDPKSAHETRDSRYLAIPFFDACLALRLPDQPGAAELKEIDISQGITTRLHENYSDVPIDELGMASAGRQDELNWLPNKTIAKAWAEFIKTGEVGDTTPPPAPTDVRAKDGVVTWNARADFESGIGQFIVLKDGKEIGRVPDKLQSRFGRPLFQRMSYHDTPEAPLPEMKFVDKSGTPGTYRVISVNSVGLRSK